MKRIAWVILVGLWLLNVGSAYAQDIRIGYVDVRKVLTESKAGLQLKTEIEKMVKQRKENLGRQEQELKDMQKAFEKDKLVLSDSQKASKQVEFEEKVKAFQQARADAQREIDQKEHEFTVKALPRIRDIIHALAKEQKLTFILEQNQSAILYAADGPDLTQKVIERFDAQGGKK